MLLGRCICIDNLHYVFKEKVELNENIQRLFQKFTMRVYDLMKVF